MPEDTTQSSGRGGLALLLDEASALLQLDGESARAKARQGLEFYRSYNDSRLALALGGFDEPMRNAIYELLFLLHSNDPRLTHWPYVAKHYKTVNGRREAAGEPRQADLHVDGAPAGVKGLRALSERLRPSYESYVRETFRMDPYGKGGEVAEFPIVALQAVGSTGTIGQKPGESDLDLQVIYESSPPLVDASNWNDRTLSEALQQEYRLRVRTLSQKHQQQTGNPPEEAVRKKIQQDVALRLKGSYPFLYRAFAGQEPRLAQELARSPDRAVRTMVLREILDLMSRALRYRAGSGATKREALLKKRIQAIQDYINAKFPEAEIYLFVYTTEHFRSGIYDSTLEFKESSGSAYEYILNYETLMPGIQFLPTVPAHFLVTDRINGVSADYDLVLDCLSAGALPEFPLSAQEVVDLGPTLSLDTAYVARHGGAIYWEAFKASSGNLAKAMLNLLRFEMLLDPKFLQPIMHMIKSPGGIDRHCGAKPADEKQMFRYEVQLGQNRTGFPGWGVLEIERKHPALAQDPWWLRYKALKIAFEGDKGIAGMEPAERNRLSSAIDLCFCLHLRISDVLKSAQEAQSATTFREQVLGALLEAAFPADSPRRIHLSNLLSGDARGLIAFEKEMRDLFQRSMTRVEKKMAALNIREHAGKKEELNLWLNYYLENFQPQPHLVPRMIMKHLKKARAGLDVSFRPGEGWVFMSIQHMSKSGLPRRRAPTERYLPERLVLFETPSFLTGLAHCVVNGYIGAYKDESGVERRTVIEMDPLRVRQERDEDNELAWLDLGALEKLHQRIAAFFPYRSMEYREMIQSKRKITELFLCLNAFRFGRLSFLYRNNVNTWYCEDHDLKELNANIRHYSADPEILMEAEPIHRAVLSFLDRHHADPETVPIGAWVNPRSFRSGLRADFHALQRDFEEGRTFCERVLAHLGIAPPKLAKAQ